MDILTLAKQLWPILKPRVIALVATELQKLATRGHVTLANEEAVALASLLVAQLEALLEQDVADPVLVKAAGALARAALVAPSPVAAPKRAKMRGRK